MKNKTQFDHNLQKAKRQHRAERKWIAYDKNHSMDSISGLIVTKGKESDNPNPKFIKGIAI